MAWTGKQEDQDANGHAINCAPGEAGDRHLQTLTGRHNCTTTASLRRGVRRPSHSILTVKQMAPTKLILWHEQADRRSGMLMDMPLMALLGKLGTSTGRPSQADTTAPRQLA